MKKNKLISLIVSVLMVVSILFSPTAVKSYAAEGKTVQVTIHYNRPDSNYTSWNVWCWALNAAGKAYEFNKEDSYGKIAEFIVENPGNESKIGFIIRKGEWQAKDVEVDRFAQVKDGRVEIWLAQGEATLYASEQEAKSAVVPKLKGGTIEGLNSAVLKTNLPFEITNTNDITIKLGTKELQILKVENPNIKSGNEMGYEILNNKIHFILTPGRFDVPELDKDGKSRIFIAGGANSWDSKGAQGWELSWNNDKRYYELSKDFKKDINFGDEFKFINIVNGETKWMNGNNIKVVNQAITDTALVTTKENFELGKTYTIAKKGFSGESVLTFGDTFYTGKDFNAKYEYTGNDLGFTYSVKSTSFRVWAPFAEKVSLITYKSGDISSKEKGTVYAMKKDVKGTWTVTIKGNLSGVFYTYKVKNPGLGEAEAGDPYAKAVGVNGDRSAVIDLTKVNPKNWSADKKPVLQSITDAVIYELHIRDLAMNKDSGIKNKGKFIEFKENVPKGTNGITRGINHLKDLGVNVLHILPSFDYATIDEKTLNKNDFNWGYDPKNYNVPEGSYSTNPLKPEVRITEYKEMVQALHQNGIRVVMDVVYNHTNDNITSKFNKIVPGYYYRMNPDGSFKNGSGCGSETASERAMVRKYIVDSVKYWAKEYHVDGFRFDLMGLHDVETMKLVKSELSKIDKTIIVYGEGWDMGNLPRDERAIQPHANQMEGIGFFNDNVRDNLKGPWNDSKGHGFVDGKQNYELEIMEAIAGSTGYNDVVKDYNSAPGQSINYVDAHDNHTLWDKLVAANPKASEADLVKMDTLANAIVLTSQGVPFMQAGADFLRTKNGDENSYKSPDSVNALDWGRKAQYIDVFNYYKGLIELRKSHPAFRMTTSEMIRQNLTFIESPRNTVAYALNNNANNDAWKNIFVAYNSNSSSRSIAVPKGNWSIVVKDNRAGVKTLESFSGGELSVPALSTIVMYTNDNVEFKSLFSGKNIAKAKVNSNTIKVNGTDNVLDKNITQSGEVIYLPVASLAKAIGADVKVDEKTANITITKGTNKIEISGNKLTVNSEAVTSSQTVTVTEGVTLISADLVEKLLDVKIFADYRRYNVDSTREDDNSPDIYIVY